MKKKSFTLIEVLVSIGLFSIIVFFLYQTLHTTRFSNKIFSTKVEQHLNKIKLTKLIIKDFLLSTKVNISYDNEKNGIIMLQTSNTYHNAFYHNIVYLVTKKANLVRLESGKEFNKFKLNDNYFDQTYIDYIAKDIKQFKIARKKDKSAYIIYIKYQDQTDMIFAVKSVVISNKKGR
jgi:hypothetical protein